MFYSVRLPWLVFRDLVNHECSFYIKYNGSSILSSLGSKCQMLIWSFLLMKNDPAFPCWTPSFSDKAVLQYLQHNKSFLFLTFFMYERVYGQQIQCLNHRKNDGYSQALNAFHPNQDVISNFFIKTFILVQVGISFHVV
jgi:hypothetical protein